MPRRTTPAASQLSPQAQLHLPRPLPVTVIDTERHTSLITRLHSG
jgi:hypothetical protein